MFQDHRQGGAKKGESHLSEESSYFFTLDIVISI